METEQAKKEETPQKPGQEPKAGASGDALKDRLGEVTSLSESELVDTLAENWMKLAGGLLVLVLGVWLYNELSAANTLRRGQAAERFAAMQNAYGAMQAEEEQPVEDADAEVSEQGAAESKAATEGAEAGNDGSGDAVNERVFQDNSSVLTSTDSGTIYAEFAKLYEFAREVQQNPGTADAANYELPEFSAGDSTLGREQLVAELAELVEVRAKLNAAGTEATAIADVRDRLRTLTASAELIPLETLLIFARLADTDPLRQEAKKMAEELRERKPALGDQVVQELSVLRITLDS